MKKLVISSDLLKQAFHKLGQAVNNKSVLPALKNVYCKVEKKEVEFVTTDTELTISYKCEIESEGAPFELLLPYDFVNRSIAYMHASVTIEHPSARKARILCLSDLYELDSLDKLDEFPNVPALPKKNMVVMDEKFLPMLATAILTTKKDDPAAPSAFSHALLELNKKESCLVSADGPVLYKHIIHAKVEEPEKLLLSQKVSKALEGLGLVQVSWNQNHIGFLHENIMVIATQSDLKYVDYKKVLNGGCVANLSVERSILVEALQKACLSSSQTKQTNIFLKKQEGQVHFEIDDPDYSRKITVDFPATYTGEVEQISVNAKKMLTAMQQIDVQSVRLHIEAADKAVLISSEEDAEYSGLIMPLKINN
jgi:DNA polymerase-3 subunit beta